jgi:hypothetical protein
VRLNDRAWHIAARCSGGCAEPDGQTIAGRRESPCAPGGECESCISDHRRILSASRPGFCRRDPGSVA